MFKSNRQTRQAGTIIIVLLFLLSFLLISVGLIDRKLSIVQKIDSQLVFAEAPFFPDEIILNNESMTQNQLIDDYIQSLCMSQYTNVDPYVVHSMIWYESRYDANAINSDGTCVGLMQISTAWHKDRASKLNINNFYDPLSNIHLGIDYISELNEQYKDLRLVLMLYNMKHNDAFTLYRKGKISNYALSILNRTEKLKRGEIMYDQP